MIFNSFSFQHLILATMYFEKVWLAGVIHAERFGKRYHFSWLEAGPNTKWDWEGARNYCRKFCMDSIAINSVAESKWVKNLIRWKTSSVKFLTKSMSLIGLLRHPCCNLPHVIMLWFVIQCYSMPLKRFNLLKHRDRHRFTVSQKIPFWWNSMLPCVFQCHYVML